MAVPNQSAFYRPVLEIAAEAADRGVSRQEIIEAAAIRLDVSESDRQEAFGGSGTVKKFGYRVDSAARQLEAAGLLSRPERGRFQITAQGRHFLDQHTGPIERQQLVQLERELQTEDTRESIIPDAYDGEETVEEIAEIAPEEIMNQANRRLRDELASDLLVSIRSISPDSFERLVVALLVKMGYGQGERVGGSGDRGIDGIINQDALGLEKVYIQAKLYTAGSVGEPDIRNFSGSLDAQGATKGVFITTSTFSGTARQTAQNISAGNKFIRLIDGNELARLMIDHGVGVITELTYEVKRLDENYFAEEI